MQRSRWPVTVMVVTLAAAACGSGTSVRSTSANTDSPTAGTSDATPSAETATTGTQGTLNWTACDDPSAEDPSLECATLSVPLDYDDPTGDTIDLALIKVPATGDRQGAVLFNPGGPAAPASTPSLSSGTAISSALGIETLDLIGFDPRGVDRSGGIRCVSDSSSTNTSTSTTRPTRPEEQALKDEAENGFIDGCKADVRRHVAVLFDGEHRPRHGCHPAGARRRADLVPRRLVRHVPRCDVRDHVPRSGPGDGARLGLRAQRRHRSSSSTRRSWSGSRVPSTTGRRGARTRPTCDFKAPTSALVGTRCEQQLDDTPITGIDGRWATTPRWSGPPRPRCTARASGRCWPPHLHTPRRGDAAGIFALADSYNGRNEDGTFTTLFQSLPVIQCASGNRLAAPPDDPEALAATIARRGATIRQETSPSTT